MGAGIAETRVRELFEAAGVRIGGTSRCDLQIHDHRFYRRVFMDGNLGLGEAYMDGLWDSPALDEMIERLLRAGTYDRARARPREVALLLCARLLNFQKLTRAFEVGRRHYDIGNDLFEAMLDSRMIYSCAYWRNADDLEDAQLAKLDLVCRKIGLKPGAAILDLGCGWGGFARYAAETYGAEVTGLTISREQAESAARRCRGLPVEIRLADYRTARGRYDAVVSLGMLEHVGPKNYRTYMEVIRRCLKPGGVVLIQTICGNDSMRYVDPWIHRYIFPNGVIPSLAQLGRAMEGLFVSEDVHNFGPYYDRTLLAWYDNLRDEWPRLDARYDARFRRMWNYYLLSCAASFRARCHQLLQLVMTPVGAPQPDCRHQ
ncbi:MAG: cyclopropane fatty acyl phospholipid synthase [Deltaproteobacteria bacterium]|nr:cyclopropane fatty acyl phospholipid synthase [Deltaproteobacteria bacterium]MBW2541760.1 cyclopropane fatty acyl phospholipid synthase [Deltaproteobacteria bacterium]